MCKSTFALANYLQILIAINLTTMASIKIVLDKRRAKTDGTYPVKLRLTHQSKTSNLSCNIYLDEKEWDLKRQEVKPSHQNYQKLNFKLSKLRLEIQEVILDFESKRKPFSAHSIIDTYKRGAINYSFKQYAEIQIQYLIDGGKLGTARTYKNSIDKLFSFCKNKQLRFEEIDYSFLEKFQNSMLKEGLKVNSISVYMRSIRAIYNRGIKSGIVDRVYYPFNDFQIKSEKTVSRALTKKEMKLIQDYPLKIGSSIWKNREYFILAFNLIGISFVDLAFLKRKNIVDGRIIYKRKKTGKNYSIKLTKKAMAVLKYFKVAEKSPDEFLLPIIKADSKSYAAQLKNSRQGYRHCNRCLKRLIKEIGIEKDITTYWSRYSWANIAKSYGYSKDLIAEALGHEYGNRVTGIYLDNYGNDVIDKANSKISLLK